MRKPPIGGRTSWAHSTMPLFCCCCVGGNCSAHARLRSGSDHLGHGSHRRRPAFHAGIPSQSGGRETARPRSTTDTVTRDGAKTEVAVHELVPGDVAHLSAGDMIPADLRLISAKDLFVSQSALTGESLPVAKFTAGRSGNRGQPARSPRTVLHGDKRDQRCRRFLSSDRVP